MIISTRTHENASLLFRMISARVVSTKSTVQMQIDRRINDERVGTFRIFKGLGACRPTKNRFPRRAKSIKAFHFSKPRRKKKALKTSDSKKSFILASHLFMARTSHISLSVFSTPLSVSFPLSVSVCLSV